MKTFVLSIALLLAAGPALAVDPVEPPTCDLPATRAACVTLIIGDIIVGPGEEREMNNGTYVVQGSVTVENGGRLEIITSDIAVGDEDAPIVIRAGGSLVIDGSDVTAAPSLDPVVIVLEDGASGVVVESNFIGIGLRVETNDAEIHDNTHQRAQVALDLVDYDGTVRDLTFNNNSIGVRASGGTPTLVDLDFTTDARGIVLDATTATVARVRMVDIEVTGVEARNSAGSFTAMNIQDRVGPPTQGFDIQAGAGLVTIEDSHVTRWGTGLFYCNAQVDYVGLGNSISGNLVDVDTC